MICKFQHDGICCNCGSLHYQRLCMERNCPHITPISNADRIRSMTDEELAEYLLRSPCDKVRHDDFDCYGACEDCVSIWLKQPYKEDT